MLNPLRIFRDPTNAIAARLSPALVLLLILLVPGRLQAEVARPPQTEVHVATELCPAAAGGVCPVLGDATPQSPVAPAHARGYVPPPIDLSHYNPGVSPDLFPSGALPAAWDWRNVVGVNYVTPVKNQSSCGSCWAFAALGDIEARERIDGAAAPGPDYSENNLKECNWSETTGAPGENSCAGGNYWMVANQLSKVGTVFESDDPYQPIDVPCQSGAGPYQTTLLDWHTVSGSTVPPEGVLKQVIRARGPLYTTIWAGDTGVWATEFDQYDGSYTLYYGGFVPQTNHAVLIVGWDDSLVHAGGTGAWIVKNSWGTGWGDAGFFYIAYGSADIGTHASYVADWQPYDENGQLLYYDEGGLTGIWGGGTTGWGTNVFTATADTFVTRVEFWTPDAMTDVDISLHDGFDGNAPGAVLWSGNDYAFAEVGYHSVALAEPLLVTSGTAIAAVVKFEAATAAKPVPLDLDGISSHASYLSLNGVNWSPSTSDIGIRLRTTAALVDVSIAKGVLGDAFEPGDAITYTLTLGNSGTGAASGVIVTDILPSEVLSTMVASTLAITETGSADYVWDVEPLAPGATEVITIAGRIDEGADEGMGFVNEASIWDPQDLTPANNRSSVSVGVRKVFLPLVLRSYPPLQTRIFYPTGDAAVMEGEPTTNTGSDPMLSAGFEVDGCQLVEGAPDMISRSLVRFDLSTLPASSVKQATLYLREWGDCGWVGAPNPTITAYRVTGDWSEYTVTWGNAPGFAEGYGSVVIHWSDEVFPWVELDVTGLVNAWLGGAPNYGLVLRGYERSDSGSVVVRIPQSGTGYGPYLEVEYYGPTTVR